MTTNVAKFRVVAAKHPVWTTFVLVYAIFILAATIAGGSEGLFFALVMPWVGAISFLCGICIQPWWASTHGDWAFLTAFGVEILVFVTCGITARRTHRYAVAIITVVLLLASNCALNLIFNQWASDL